MIDLHSCHKNTSSQWRGGGGGDCNKMQNFMLHMIAADNFLAAWGSQAADCEVHNEAPKSIAVFADLLATLSAAL